MRVCSAKKKSCRNGIVRERFQQKARSAATGHGYRTRLRRSIHSFTESRNFSQCSSSSTNTVLLQLELAMHARSAGRFDKVAEDATWPCTTYDRQLQMFLKHPRATTLNSTSESADRRREHVAESTYMRKDGPINCRKEGLEPHLCCPEPGPSHSKYCTRSSKERLRQERRCTVKPRYKNPLQCITCGKLCQHKLCQTSCTML